MLTRLSSRVSTGVIRRVDELGGRLAAGVMARLPELPIKRPEPSVELAPGAGDNGFAEMLATLLRQNLDERPEKREAFSRMLGRVAIVLEDLDSAVTLDFARGQLRIFSGVVGIPDLTVRAPWEWVTKMSLVELEPIFGLPDMRKPIAKEVSQAQQDGTIKMAGMFTNLPLVLRLTQVMSVAE